MKRTLAMLAGIALVLAVTAARAADTPPPPSEPYQLALLRRGPGWTPGRSARNDTIQARHMANTRRMFDAGELHAAGPFGDDTPLRGLFILRTDSARYVSPMLQGDSALATGRLRAELHRWHGPAGIGRAYRERMAGANPPRDSMVSYAFVMLRRGPRYTSNFTPGVRKLLGKHARNIERLRRESRLVAAGPVEGMGDLRGILIFDADTTTARRLVSKDPAVRGGRFVAEIHPWWTAYGIIPGH
ncbi:MAG: hypothetical protein IT348_14380 [Candidatus Eisenbacteria bacterium]|nr:hypothetical protein [Candidatus Eisenbacteria bacterium]